MSTYYVAGIPYSDELYHHGIKGQKWGVRNYQNEDGSLTSQGRKRYGVSEAFSGLKSKASNMWDKHVENSTNRGKVLLDKNRTRIGAVGRHFGREAATTLAITAGLGAVTGMLMNRTIKSQGITALHDGRIAEGARNAAIMLGGALAVKSAANMVRDIADITRAKNQGYKRAKDRK